MTVHVGTAAAPARVDAVSPVEGGDGSARADGPRHRARGGRSRRPARRRRGSLGRGRGRRCRRRRTSRSSRVRCPAPRALRRPRVARCGRHRAVPSSRRPRPAPSHAMPCPRVRRRRGLARARRRTRRKRRAPSRASAITGGWRATGSTRSSVAPASSSARHHERRAARARASARDAARAARGDRGEARRGGGHPRRDQRGGTRRSASPSTATWCGCPGARARPAPRRPRARRRWRGRSRDAGTAGASEHTLAEKTGDEPAELRAALQKLARDAAAVRLVELWFARGVVDDARRVHGSAISRRAHAHRHRVQGADGPRAQAGRRDARALRCARVDASRGGRESPTVTADALRSLPKVDRVVAHPALDEARACPGRPPR